MAGTWTSERFPQFETAIRRLAERHRELEDEPLHLAISYGPGRDQQDIFLFELVGGSTVAGVNADRELFEATLGSAASFPMGPGQRLHLVLTNRPEFETALREGWPSAREVQGAIRAGDYVVLYADDVGQQVLDWIRAEIQREVGTARG